MRPVLLILFVLNLPTIPAFAQVDHVIMIGVDGMSAEGVSKAKVPNLRALMAKGSWTLKARSVMPTVSSPNWASLIMGAGPEQHGITSNEWEPGKHTVEPVCAGTTKLFPSIFGELKRHGPTLQSAVFHDWQGFGRLFEPNAPEVVQHQKGSEPTMTAAIEYWKKERPALLFIHLDDVDHAGHDREWMSEIYMSELERIDGLIGGMIETLDSENAWRDTAVLIVADHGGLGKKHGGESMNEFLIPFIIVGSGVKAGYEIRRPVSNTDPAPTVAKLLGIPAHPCWTGRSIDEALK